MKATPADIAEYVIFSGDPFRVEVLKDILDSPRHIAFSREFNTYTGTYKGVRITVTSTGIGAPSAAIAMEEMYENGMKVAIRMGTVMGLQDHMLGKFFIPLAAMREEATSTTYVPLSYPAVADFELVTAMNQAVKENGGKYLNGISCTMDGYYSQMKENHLSRKLQINVQKTFEDLKRLDVMGIDMESSVILTLGRLLGIKACVVTLTTVLENLKAQIFGEERTKAEALLCQIVLDGIIAIERRKE
ncbi:MAG: nucleoside phosphorylase [Tissierellia bacterium]|nr:nucleoside phosphorylase [Tissierellia bacterium]